MIRVGLLLCVLFLPAQLLFAQVAQETFSIQVFGGSDSTAPTTPMLLTATAVASTQINLSWASSTDNFAVNGYSIFRDSVPIATTTLTTYFDTGLTASTTYVYQVRAFDAAVNYSTSSNSATATTPAAPTVPPTATNTSSGSEGTSARVVADEFVIQTDTTSAVFDIETARPARIELRWGRTASYELGYIVRDVFVTEHMLPVRELEPGTIYEYELIGFTPSGARTVIGHGQFQTDSVTTVGAPANVFQFAATAKDEDVELLWQLPQQNDIAHVRIVRSHLGFPTHPHDGAIVYQGGARQFVDAGILTQYSPVYYTAFTYDINGNISSGAVAVVYREEKNTAVLPGESGPFTAPEIYIFHGSSTTILDGATSSVDLSRVLIDMTVPGLQELLVIQNEDTYTFLEPSIILNGYEVFKVSIPAEHISQNLKTIILSVVDPTDNRQVSRYLLRINKDRTAYEAFVAPALVAGASRLQVDIYDYQSYRLSQYQAPVTFILEEKTEVVFPDKVFSPSMFWWAVGCFGLLILLLLFFWRRSQTEDKH